MLPQGNYQRLLLLPPSHLPLLQLLMLLLLWANTSATTATMQRLIASGAIARNTLLLQAQQQQQRKADEEFVQFLKYVRQEQNYSTIVLLTATSDRKDNCINMAQMMAQVLQQPLLLLNDQQQYVLQTMRLNSAYLMVVCMRHSDNRNLLRALSLNLRYQREKRIIFRMPLDRRGSCEENYVVATLVDLSFQKNGDSVNGKYTKAKNRRQLKNGDRIEINTSKRTSQNPLLYAKRDFMDISKNRMQLKKIDATKKTSNDPSLQIKRVFMKDISENRMELKNKDPMETEIPVKTEEERNNSKGSNSKLGISKTIFKDQMQYKEKATRAKEGSLMYVPLQVKKYLVQENLTQEISKARMQRKIAGLMEIEINDTEQTSEDLIYLQKLFRYCQSEQMLNVIAVWRDFPIYYYSYTRFLRFRILRQHFDENTTIIFPNRLSNLEGYPIRTLPDQYVPRSWAYTDHRTGRQQMGGYCAHFLGLFARHLNATLVLAKRLEIGSTMFYADMLNYTRNNVVDIPTSLMGPINDTEWAEYSYPYELTDWCVLLPVEPQLTQSEIYASIVNWFACVALLSLTSSFSILLIVAMHRLRGRLYHRSWCDVLLNDKAWRGVLGQSFAFKCRHLDWFVKWVFFLLFVTGLTVNTLYSVFLQSYMTHPPHHRRITSFAEMNRSPLRLLISRNEYALIYPAFYEQYHTLFAFTASFEEFRRLRQTPNASFGYPVTRSLWPLIRAQQQHYSRARFRYSHDLCFVRFYPLFFLLPVNSIYRDVLHLFMLRVHEFGLSDFWLQSGFRELVALGRLPFADVTVPHKYSALSLADVSTIFQCFALLLVLSFLVFVAELVFGIGNFIRCLH